jgi:hypothetical protein
MTFGGFHPQYEQRDRRMVIERLSSLFRRLKQIVSGQGSGQLALVYTP